MTENGGKLPPRKFVHIEGQRLELWEPVIGVGTFNGQRWVLSRDKDGFERKVPEGWGIVTVPEFDSGTPIDQVYLIPPEDEIERRLQEIRDQKARKVRDDEMNDLRDAGRAAAAAEEARAKAERDIATQTERARGLRSRLGLGA